MSDQTDQLEAQEQQRDTAKRATLDAMRKKQRKRDEFEMQFGDEWVSFLFVAIGSIEYDRLLTECPPNTEQLARGLNVDQDKLGPILLSRVCHEPKFSVEEWTEVWKSPEWSRGEIMELYNRAGMLNLSGVNIRPINAG